MIGFTKITVLMLYRRIFVAHRWCWFDISILSLITILACFYGITTFFKIFECSPRAKIFNMALPGHCYNVGTILKTSGAFNTITDFLILLLPVHAVHKLQMTRQKKILVVLVFTFGLWYVVPCYPFTSTAEVNSSSAPLFLPPSDSLFGCKKVPIKIPHGVSPPFSSGGKFYPFPLSLFLCVCLYFLILRRSLAELTSGNLCFCFPEMSALFRSRTRHRTRNTPRRATASELAPYKRQKKLRSNDPYMMSTLVKTVGTITSSEGGPYTELEDNRYGAQIATGDKTIKSDEPKNGKIIIDSEISVRSHETL